MSSFKEQSVRNVRPTALIYCEGLNDAKVVGHLINLYCGVGSDTGYQYKVKHGTGGSPYTLVNDAQKMPHAYDRRLVIMDNDVPAEEIEKAHNLINKSNSGTELLLLSPCLEGVLLKIVCDEDHSGLDSKGCKNHFEDKFLSARDRIKRGAYNNLLTLEAVEASKDKVVEIAAILSFISGGPIQA